MLNALIISFIRDWWCEARLVHLHYRARGFHRWASEEWYCVIVVSVDWTVKLIQ